jgi:sensor histidine kinase YesM
MINAILMDDETKRLERLQFAIENCGSDDATKDANKTPEQGLGILKIIAVLVYSLSFSFLYGQVPLKIGNSKLDLIAQGAPTPAQLEVDSLKALLKNIPDGPDKVEVYGNLCFAHASTLANVAIARLYADSIKLLADQLEDETVLAASNYYYGLVARYEGKYSEALNYFERQIEYCNTSGDSSRLASSLFQMAAVHMELGNYEQSLAISYRAIEMYEKHGSSFGMAHTFMHIGNLFGRLKNFDEAIKMYNQSLTIFDTLKAVLQVKMNKLRLLINLGNSYSELKQYERARKFYNQSLVISRSLGSQRTTATTLSNIGGVLNDLGQYDSALVYHLQALSIREQTSQKDKILASLIRVGETYLFLREYPLATRYLLRSLSLSKEFQSKPNLRYAYQTLSALYSAQRNFEKAYEYHQLFVAMKDSVLNEETARQLSELQTKYETSEKDKQITLLAKEKEVQQKEAERQATLNKAFVGGLALVMLLAALVFYIFRQRLHLTAKNNEVREANYRRQVSELEMKALRAQINPHFLFNCMNAINLMILKGETENASLYLAKFSKLVRSILENSETADVTLESEMALLESYMQLEGLRLPGKLGYRISIHESVGIQSTYLPSMVLQPVVENAIWHGIVHKENDLKGDISIDVRQYEDQLLCTIEDNGVGRDKAEQFRDKSILKHKSMGMKITEERLQLRSRKPIRQCIEITDLKDTLNRAVGTRVTIHIPISEQND